MSPTEDPSMKILALRRPDTCAGCGTSLEVGARASWEAATRSVRCLPCANVPGTFADVADATHLAAEPTAAPAPAPPPFAPPPLQPPRVAGGSAQREHDRRSQKRQAEVRSRHPRLGGLLLALTDDPASTRVWAQGARGERAVAASLTGLDGELIVALHDRKVVREDGRASRGNIDHLLIAAAGVWVVDAKTHRGTLEVRRSGGLFSPRVEKLYIAGRDKTPLLDGLAGQVDSVKRVLAEVGADLPVRGALCFVGTELPWFGESIRGVPLVGRRGLNKLLRQPGDLVAADRASLAHYLNRRFIPA